MSSSIPNNPTSHNVLALLPKLRDADADIRFMSLNDLHQMLVNGSSSMLTHDFSTCTRLTDGLLGALADTHGEVQNQAIKCLAPFANKAPENALGPAFDKIAAMKRPEDFTVPALALRSIVLALPHPVVGAPRSKAVTDAYGAVSKTLIPRLLGKANKYQGLVELDLESGQDSNSLDLLAEVARCYGPMLSEQEVQAIQVATMEILASNNSSPVMRKKAVVALSALAPYFSEALLSHLVSTSIEALRQTHLTSQQRKVYLSIYGSLSRAIPQNFGPYLTTLTPFTLAPLSQLELDQQVQAEEESGERDNDIDEVREVALASIEAFFQTCPEHMVHFIDDVVEDTIRFVKYDPAFVEDADDDIMEDEDDDLELDEDFEEDTGFGDDDDVSWKVRRGSVRALHALISSLSPSDRRPLYSTVTQALIPRFKEKEESVRGEVLATMTTVVSKNGIFFTPEVEQASPPASRKRRRGGSDAFVTDSQHALLNGYTSPSTPPPSDDFLSQISAELVSASSKLLKTSTPATKLAVITLLRQLVQTQRGGLSKTAEQVITPLLETLNTDTSNDLRAEALTLLSAIAQCHSGKALQPLFGDIVPVLVSLASDRYARTAIEAFAAIESYIRAFTPPRTAASKSENAQYLGRFQDVILQRIQDAETEVKAKAIEALGLLLGRTSGPQGNKLLSQPARFAGQKVLLERMRNELTRLASVRAFDTVAVLTQTKSDCSPPLINEIVLELGAQLRKASRSLRGASLSTLRALCVNNASRACLTDQSLSELVKLLLPLIEGDDLHMLGPAIAILGVLAEDKPILIATDTVNTALTKVAASSLTGSSLEALIACTTAIGRSSSSAALMKLLLQQGVSGDIDVLGRVIGALLVASGQNSPVNLQDFIKELNTQADTDRQCLALSVLGEAGLRLGPSFTMTPQELIAYFNSPSEKVKLATAVALGRAGAGNVKVFLPVIIDALGGEQQYLVLHSVKELLHHSNAEHEILPLAQNLWEHVITSGQTEDNKVVSAECIGRLAMIDPSAYLSQVQSFLKEGNPITRGMIMIALRYVFSDTDEAYDVHLKDTIFPMLSAALADTDLDNQRLALSAFNSAFQNKTVLVLPHLGQLLGSIIPATVVRNELVREVSMGPFKHKVDDGLEIRKSAYETMFLLLEQPMSRQQIDLTALYDRVIAGITDEHEIKIICCLILSKLVGLAKEETHRRLDSLAQAFRTVLSFKPKDTAVKQELEKITEHNKAVLRASVQVNRIVAQTSEQRVWREYMDWIKRDYQSLLKAAEEELKVSST